MQRILDPATFAGIVISDDAAVYANFTQTQKCWAHLLRKAIKLTLLEPTNGEYRRFTDRLLEIYRSAGKVQRDRRLSGYLPLYIFCGEHLLLAKLRPSDRGAHY